MVPTAAVVTGTDSVSVAKTVSRTVSYEVRSRVLVTTPPEPRSRVTVLGCSTALVVIGAGAVPGAEPVGPWGTVPLLTEKGPWLVGIAAVPTVPTVPAVPTEDEAFEVATGVVWAGEELEL